MGEEKIKKDRRRWEGEGSRGGPTREEGGTYGRGVWKESSASESLLLHL